MWGVLCHVLCDGSCVGWCAIRGVGCDMFVACEVACCVERGIRGSVLCGASYTR